MVKEIILGLFIILTTGVIALHFKSFKEWLVYAVSEAEEYLGSGTGKLKLMYVYNLAVSKYSFITKLITFDMFSKFVEDALSKMKEMIDSNERIADILNTKVLKDND